VRRLFQSIGLCGVEAEKFLKMFTAENKLMQETTTKIDTISIGDHLHGKRTTAEEVETIIGEKEVDITKRGKIGDIPKAKMIGKKKKSAVKIGQRQCRVGS
jgi:hypothetical protein